MSTKNLREMLSEYEDMIGSSTSEVGSEAKRELEAIEKAAKALAEAGWLTVIPEESGRTQAEADGAELLASIAKDAP